MEKIPGLFPMQPCFQANVPSINMPLNLSLASSKFGQHQEKDEIERIEY